MAFYVDEFGRLVEVDEEQEWSDHDQLTADLAEAGVAPNGGAESDIQKSVNFNRIKQEENGAESKAVNIAPLSVIKNADPKFGDHAVCTAGGPAMEVVRWAGDVNEARAITLSFGWNNPSITGVLSAASGTPANRPYAIVNYGTRNYTQNYVCDISKGQNISFSASWVTVAVGLDLVSGSNGTLDIGASIGFFGSGGSCPVTRTIYLDTAVGIAGSGPSARMIVPIGAKQLLPIQRTFNKTPGTPDTLLPAAFLLTFYDINGNAVGEMYGGDTVYSVMSGPLPLPNDAYSFDVENFNTTTEIPKMRFIFQLGF